MGNNGFEVSSGFDLLNKCKALSHKQSTKELLYIVGLTDAKLSGVQRVFEDE